MARAVGRFFLEHSLQDYELSQFRPSVLALCMWKVSLAYLKTYTENDCIHSEIKVEQNVYDNCLEKVQQFFESTQQIYPEISTLHDKYIYGVKLDITRSTL